MTDPQNKVPFFLAGEGAYLRYRTGDLVHLREKFGEPKPIKVRNEMGFEQDAIETFTDRLNLRIAVDYSSRDAILAAAARLGPEGLSRDAMSEALCGPGDVDLLIRTGGEKRLSDFLLWEAAYAELHFTERMWPDFGAADLAAAVADFSARDRRFGGLNPPLLTAAA